MNIESYYFLPLANAEGRLHSAISKLNLRFICLLLSLALPLPMLEREPYANLHWRTDKELGHVHLRA